MIDFSLTEVIDTLPRATSGLSGVAYLLKSTYTWPMNTRLVISRRIGERISIGDDIEIMITDIHGRKVDIAILAPRELKITRLTTHVVEQERYVNRIRSKPRQDDSRR